MKNIFSKTIQLSIIALLLSFTVNAEAYEKEGKIEKEFNIGNNTRIEFSNKSSDLNIKIWDKQTVKLECFYKLKANDEEDVMKTIDALQNLEVEQSNSVLSIQTGIFTKINSTVISGLIKKFVGTLSSGTVVRLKEYKIEYILTLPDNHEFMLKQKYSDVSMPSYSGEVELDLYDVDMTAGRLDQAQLLKTKYSDLNFESLGNCVVDLYDTGVKLGSMGDLNLKSKYSKFELEEVGSVIIESYDDKLYFPKLNSIKGSAKYTDLNIGDVEFADLNLYDCELRAHDCGNLKLVGKYSGIVFDKVNIFEYPDCYDNTVKANFVGEFSAVSKYTEFEFGHVAGFIDLNTYDDKLIVDRMDADFYSIRVDGKYTDVSINLLGKAQFFLDVNFKYTKYELPEDVLYSDVNTKSSQFIASGRTEGLKKDDQIKVQKNKLGIRKANIGKVSIEQYDGTLKIK
jgi:hypothetical protein